MAWNQKFAAYLVIAQDAGLITPSEYGAIRSVLDSGKHSEVSHSGEGQIIRESDDSRNKLESGSPYVVQYNSGFKFGTGSRRELEGVNTDLFRVTHLALQYSLQDFCVYDGIRTLKEQEQHVKNGTSKTMQSKHLQGLAVDLVPWINGKPTWDWDGCYKIACAVDKAATELGLAHRITWGGAWDRKLSDFGGDVSEYAKEVQAYQKRHPGPDFIDGPHFEILP